jgi:hypothetical protein
MCNLRKGHRVFMLCRDYDGMATGYDIARWLFILLILSYNKIVNYGFHCSLVL